MATLIVERKARFAMPLADRYSAFQRGEIVTDGANDAADAERPIHALLQVRAHHEPKPRHADGPADRSAARPGPAVA